MSTSTVQLLALASACATAMGCAETAQPNVGAADSEDARAVEDALHDAQSIEESGRHAWRSSDAAPTAEPSADAAGAILVRDAGAGEAGAPAGQKPIAIQSLLLTRRGAAGFCIEDGQLATAEVTPAGEEALVLSGQVHRGWNDAALDGCNGTDCERLEAIGPREISAAERRDLEQLIERLPSGGCPDQVNFVCDPCLVSSLIFNGASYGGDPCTAGCSGSVEVVLEIGAMLDRWVAP